MLPPIRCLIPQTIRRYLSFQSLGVEPRVISSLRRNGIKDATDIQNKTIPIGIKGYSPIVLSSETGSGKTLAYLIPYLHQYYKGEKKRCVIVVPRRELALQIQYVLNMIDPKVSCSVLSTPHDETHPLPFPDVVIGTSETVYKFVKRAFNRKEAEYLSSRDRSISYFVLDEADILLNDPFKQHTLETSNILKSCNKEMQVVIAGATLPKNGRMTAGGVISSCFKNAYWCEGEQTNRVPDHIDVEFVELGENTDGARVAVLNKYVDTLRKRPALVFVKNFRVAEEVNTQLQRFSLPTQLLSKDIKEEERKKCIEALLNGKRVCSITTDVVSRGIDTKNIDLVVQYDFPKDVMTFLHRCGRTGRMGRPGKGGYLATCDRIVICFVTPEDSILYEGIRNIGVHNDLSPLFSRKRLLNKKYKKVMNDMSV